MTLMITDGVMRRSYLTVSWTKKNSEASQDYRNKILDYQSNNPQDNFDNKQMIAMTRTWRRSIKFKTRCIISEGEKSGAIRVDFPTKYVTQLKLYTVDKLSSPIQR